MCECPVPLPRSAKHKYNLITLHQNPIESPMKVLVSPHQKCVMKLKVTKPIHGLPFYVIWD